MGPDASSSALATQAPPIADRAAAESANARLLVMPARPSLRWTTITVDCADAEALGAFYSELFGWEITARDGAGWLQLRNPDGGISISVQAEVAYAPPIWPDESGMQAKMMHFEVLVDDLEAAVGFVLERGGTQSPHQPADRDPRVLRIMLDPAGHPFCLFVEGE